MKNKSLYAGFLFSLVNFLGAIEESQVVLAIPEGVTQQYANPSGICQNVNGTYFLAVGESCILFPNVQTIPADAASLKSMLCPNKFPYLGPSSQHGWNQTYVNYGDCIDVAVAQLLTHEQNYTLQPPRSYDPSAYILPYCALVVTALKPGKTTLSGYLGYNQNFEPYGALSSSPLSYSFFVVANDGSNRLEYAIQKLASLSSELQSKGTAVLGQAEDGVIQDNEGNTVLMLAIMEREVSVAEFLINTIPYPELIMVNKKNHDALWICGQMGYIYLISLIEKRMAAEKAKYFYAGYTDTCQQCLYIPFSTGKGGVVSCASCLQSPHSDETRGTQEIKVGSEDYVYNGDGRLIVWPGPVKGVLYKAFALDTLSGAPSVLDALQIAYAHKMSYATTKLWSQLSAAEIQTLNNAAEIEAYIKQIGMLVAAQYDDNDLAKILLSKNYPFDQKNVQNQTPLMIAIAHKNVELSDMIEREMVGAYFYGNYTVTCNDCLYIPLVKGKSGLIGCASCQMSPGKKQIPQEVKVESKEYVSAFSGQLTVSSQPQSSALYTPFPLGQMQGASSLLEALQKAYRARMPRITSYLFSIISAQEVSELSNYSEILTYVQQVGIIAATENNDAQLVEQLLAKGCSAVGRNSQGQTPLIIALVNKNLSLAKRLSEFYNAEQLGYQDDTGYIAMMYAIKNGYRELAIYLTSHTDPQSLLIFAKDGSNPQDMAQKWPDLVQAYNTVSLEGPLPQPMPQGRYYGGIYKNACSLCMYVPLASGTSGVVGCPSCKGSQGAQEAMVSEGEYVLYNGNGGILQVFPASALVAGQIEGANYYRTDLLQGADSLVDALRKAYKNKMPYTTAAIVNQLSGKDLEDAKKLPEYVAIKSYAGQALFDAVNQDNLSEVKRLIARKYPLGITNSQGQTPLMVALSQQNTVMAQVLAHNSTAQELNQQDKQGQSAIVYALQWGAYDIALYIAQHMTDFSQTTNQGYTPLMAALGTYSQGKLSDAIIKVLLKNTPYPALMATGQGGVTALSIAYSYENEQGLANLIQKEMTAKGKDYFLNGYTSGGCGPCLYVPIPGGTSGVVGCVSCQASGPQELVVYSQDYAFNNMGLLSSLSYAASGSAYVPMRLDTLGGAATMIDAVQMAYRYRMPYTVAVALSHLSESELRSITNRQEIESFARSGDAVFQALSSNNPSFALKLAQEGYNVVNGTNQNGQNPLMIAIINKYRDVIAAIIGYYNSDQLAAYDNNANTALVYAVQNNLHDVALYLVWHTNPSGIENYSMNSVPDTPEWQDVHDAYNKVSQTAPLQPPMSAIDLSTGKPIEVSNVTQSQVTVQQNRIKDSKQFNVSQQLVDRIHNLQSKKDWPTKGIKKAKKLIDVVITYVKLPSHGDTSLSLAIKQKKKEVAEFLAHHVELKVITTPDDNGKVPLELAQHVGMESVAQTIKTRLQAGMPTDFYLSIEQGGRGVLVVPSADGKGAVVAIADAKGGVQEVKVLPEDYVSFVNNVLSVTANPQQGSRYQKKSTKKISGASNISDALNIAYKNGMSYTCATCAVQLNQSSMAQDIAAYLNQTALVGAAQHDDVVLAKKLIADNYSLNGITVAQSAHSYPQLLLPSPYNSPTVSFPYNQNALMIAILRSGITRNFDMVKLLAVQPQPALSQAGQYSIGGNMFRMNMASSSPTNLFELTSSATPSPMGKYKNGFPAITNSINNQYCQYDTNGFTALTYALSMYNPTSNYNQYYQDLAIILISQMVGSVALQLSPTDGSTTITTLAQAQGNWFNTFNAWYQWATNNGPQPALTLQTSLFEGFQPPANS